MGRTVRRRLGVAVAVGVALVSLWSGALVRFVSVHGVGTMAGVVAAGGWGLSLLPVHCVPKARAQQAAGSDDWLPRLRALRTRMRAGRPAGD